MPNPSGISADFSPSQKKFFKTIRFFSHVKIFLRRFLFSSDREKRFQVKIQAK